MTRHGPKSSRGRDTANRASPVPAQSPPATFGVERTMRRVAEMGPLASATADKAACTETPDPPLRGCGRAPFGPPPAPPERAAVSEYNERSLDLSRHRQREHLGDRSQPRRITAQSGIQLADGGSRGITAGIAAVDDDEPVRRPATRAHHYRAPAQAVALHETLGRREVLAAGELDGEVAAWLRAQPGERAASGWPCCRDIARTCLRISS